MSNLELVIVVMVIGGVLGIIIAPVACEFLADVGDAIFGKNV